MSDAFFRFERVARSTVKPAEAEDEANIHPFDQRNIHPDIAGVSQRLFDDGHYSQATFEAFKYIDNIVKGISGISDTGFSLMMNAFSETSPRIRLNELSSTSETDEQRGFRYIFAGTMAGIRNPRGHDNKNDPIDICLDHLSIASILLRTLEMRKSP